MGFNALLVSLLLVSAAAPADGTFDITGSVVSPRTTFTLRTASGCARDVRLPAITSGRTFTLALDEANLTTAFGCVVDVEADGALEDPIAVSPDAHVLASAPSLALDPLALVSSAPGSGDAVRITVVSSERAAKGTLAFGERRFAAKVAGDRFLFEIPARDYARAVLGSATLHVEIGARTMELRPKARIDVLSDDLPSS